MFHYDSPDYLMEHNKFERIKAVVTQKGYTIDQSGSRIYRTLINDTIVYAIDDKLKETLIINTNDTIEMARTIDTSGYPEYSCILAVHPYNKENANNTTKPKEYCYDMDTAIRQQREFNERKKQNK